MGVTTWSDIEFTAFAVCGLKPAEFYEMTWQEYAYYSHGVMLRKFEAWEHTRLIVASVINTVSKKAVKPSDIIKLPTDNKGLNLKGEALSEMKARWEKAKKHESVLNRIYGSSRNKGRSGSRISGRGKGV